MLVGSMVCAGMDQLREPGWNKVCHPCCSTQAEIRHLGQSV